MAVKFTAVKCPECGANLEVEEGRTQMFCSYCGTKIIMTNENEHIYRHIDEAGMKQAETDRLVQIKKMEIIERKRASAEKAKRTKVLLTVVSAGFTNIKTIPLNDLTVGLLKRPGTVESIIINGKSVTSGGKKFSPDATVVISYHSHR